MRCRRKKNEAEPEAGRKSWSVFGVLHVAWFARKMVPERDVEGSLAGKMVWPLAVLISCEGP